MDIVKEIADVAEKHASAKGLEAKQAELRERLELDRKIWDSIGDEEPDASGRKAIIDNNKRIEELDHAVAEAAEMGALRAKNSDRLGSLNTPANRLGPGTSIGGVKMNERQAQTIADLALNDPDFKSWLDRAAKSSNRMELGRSPSVSIEGAGTKALITGLADTTGGALVTTDRLSILEAGTAQRPLSILDVITTGSTGSDLVEYVRQGAITNNAAPVAEATATGGASGVKPESGFVLSVVQEAVKTIAHWMPATRRALADAPQLRTLINQILIYGLREELADQILTGDGVGENFTGLLNVSGTTAQAYDTSLLVTTRRARTKVRTVGRATPTAYVMHPADWEDLDLLQDGEQRYYFGGPMQTGTPRLWGLPVVEEEGMTEGTAMVADWKLALLWNREQANILVSDSHADFFIRNMIAVLAELRAAFGVLRPAAFVEIDLTA